jgi:hypothetical protein
MFRLIKLAMYAMIGYVLYELYQGMTQQQQQQQGGRSFSGSQGGGSFGGESDSFGAITGGGEGVTDTAADSGGGEMRHRVGRGVIRSGATL